MDASWHAVMRDILIVLAAFTFTLSCVFGGLVMWQLYRLGRALQRDVQPVIDTALETVATVRDTSTFMSERVRSVPLPAKRPPSAGPNAGDGSPAGAARGAAGMAGAVQRLFRGRR